MKDRERKARKRAERQPAPVPPMPEGIDSWIDSDGGPKEKPAGTPALESTRRSAGRPGSVADSRGGRSAAMDMGECRAGANASDSRRRLE